MAISRFSSVRQHNTELQKLFLVFFIFLSACSPVVDTPVNTGIEVHTFVGPMCPVMIEGQECPDQPYQATLTVLTSDGKKVTQFQTDENGYFRLDLPPGEYILHPESPKDSPMPYAGEQPFTVAAGVYTSLTVNYDSGIR